MVDNAVEDALPVYRATGRRFSRLLQGLTSFPEARATLSSQSLDKDFIDEHSEQLLSGMLTEDALGRSLIIDKDVHFSIRFNRQPARLVASDISYSGFDVDWIACKDDRVKVSFDVVPEEAVNYLTRKSFWISGVENDQTLKAIQRRLAAAAQRGDTYQQFLDDLEEVFVEEGLERRAQTVFRTNLYAAYSVGQLDQIQQMSDRFPLWRYIAILDSATRPEHAALNGEVFRVGEGPVPPIDYNCRCVAQYLHTYEVDANRITPGSVAPTLPNVRRFDTRSAFETWLRNRLRDMDPSIREYVQGLSPL